MAILSGVMSLFSSAVGVVMPTLIPTVGQLSADLGGKIGWDTGKDSVFRKFITNNVDLPKTSLYFKGNKHQFYLDISKRKNAKHLLNLILDNYSGEQRLLANDMFYDTLNELSFKISMDLGEMPGTINKYIIEELKN